MADEIPSWPPPPREPGPWGGGPPVAPPGNTALPPLPGAGGVVHGNSSVNPWGATSPTLPPPPVAPPPGPRPAPFPGLPDPSAGPLIDRAPTWILAAAAVVVMALIGGAVLLVTQGGRKFPSKWDARVAPIAAWVEKDRKLTYDHPVKVNFLSKAEYTKASTGGDGIDDDDSSEGDNDDDTKDQIAEYRALGFMSGEPDLKAASKSLADSGTLAYYDQDTKEVYVRGTEMTPELRVTLAHELTHVLQDQQFDLTRINKLSDTDSTVLRALAEGDATHVEDDYSEKVLTDSERKEYEQASESGSDEADQQLKDVPPVLTSFFAAPYILGPELLGYLRTDGGDQAVDKAFRDLPTEEELFNPLVYDTDASKPVDVTLDPPKGDKSLDDGNFGPTALYLLLATRMDARQALAAVDGWGGDAYYAAKDNGEVCVRADIKMDTPADTDEMNAALTVWSAQSPAGKASTKVTDGTIEFKTCDPGKDAPPIGDPAKPDLLGIPAARTEIYQQAKQPGVTRDQAVCYAQGVITRFQPSQLNDGDFIDGPEGQRLLDEAGSACR